MIHDRKILKQTPFISLIGSPVVNRWIVFIAKGLDFMLAHLKLFQITHSNFFLTTMLFNLFSYCSCILFHQNWQCLTLLLWYLYCYHDGTDRRTVWYHDMHIWRLKMKLCPSDVQCHYKKNHLSMQDKKKSWMMTTP